MPKFIDLKLYLGIVFKKADGLFLRLYTGYFWGYTALGGIQPAMSIARSVSILTPFWINLNLNGFFSTNSNSNSLKKFYWILLSYLVYLILSLIAYHLLESFSFANYTLMLLTLAFIWFGNQNTKAVLRAMNIFNGQVVFNNSILFISLITKFSISSFVLIGDYTTLLILLVLIDIIFIGILFYIMRFEILKRNQIN